MRINMYIILLGLLSTLPAFPQQYRDMPYVQDYTDKFEPGAEDRGKKLMQVKSDRNGRIAVLAEDAVFQPWEGQLVRDLQYRHLGDRKILALDSYRDQFMYLTDKAVLSNAWAGKFHVEHNMDNPGHFAMGDDFSFLLAAEGSLAFFRHKEQVWQKELKDLKPLQLLFDAGQKCFLVLSQNALYTFAVGERELVKRYTGRNLTALALLTGERQILLGTDEGIIYLDRESFKETSPVDKKLPHTQITCIREINGRLWFGSEKGAFVRRSDGKYDYYASRRWLVDDRVKDICPGPGNSVLILSEGGLSQINFMEMTLAEKAEYFQKVQRLRHIRYGFSSEGYLTRPGDPSSMVLRDTDNDGLWTSMYLAGELFRYASTLSEDALLNAYEAFEAMERLTEISGIKGFPARTYELDGYQSSDNDPDMPEDQKIWRLTNDGRWRWKSTTSSDESCGHFFVYALFAEIVPDREWKDRAIRQIKLEMDHIIEHDWYLVTWNGEITRWGRWNPEYVNSFPIQVGDRRLNSTLILAFLQTAYHFTGEDLYREKAYELMDTHGYLENALRPASVIAHVEGQMLSDSWNHSDDEMYFLTIPALVKYAFSEELKQEFFKTAQSHWEIERSEKNPLWNYLYALIGGTDPDVEDAAWWLREFPLDLVSWDVDNSHRQDLTRVDANFRKQEYTEVLPRDERPMHLHNNAYRNKGGDNGRREYPPYIYLLPYWAGRYVGAISEPLDRK